MTSSTIEKNIRRTFIKVVIVICAALLTMVFIAYERLESSMLGLVRAVEWELVLDKVRDGNEFILDGKSVKVYVQPDNQPRRADAPTLFQNLSVPFSGTLETEGASYLVKTERVNGGTFSIALDITFFEARENQFFLFLLMIGFVALVLIIVAARIVSVRLVRPIQTLTSEIRGIKASDQMPAIKEDFRDMELAEIASSFNVFLRELESYIRREQLLTGVASHELRTPVAVMSGALDILERRDSMSDVDKRTLLRIRHAVDEMSENIDTVLKLTRRRSFSDRHEEIDLLTLIESVRDDLLRSRPQAHLVIVEQERTVMLRQDPSLLKMLFRNLLQNALQHTQGKVTATLLADAVVIEDEGAGLPHEYVRYLNGELSPSNMPSLSGLGLLIVTLICERLEWGLRVESSERGTRVMVRLLLNSSEAKVRHFITSAIGN